MEQLDKKLLAGVAGVARSPKGGSQPILTLQERVAANIFWRQGVTMPVLTKVFQCSRNTLYGNALTGGGAYMSGRRAVETNRIVDRLGVRQAEAKYVTAEMIRAVNHANAEVVADQSAA